MTNKEAIEILKPLFDQCKGTDNCLGYIEHYFSKDEEKALDLAIQALEDRKQGEWIMQRHDLDGCFYTCSNCGRMIRVPLFIDDPEDNETLADYPFCHCGAKMKGGKE